MKLAFMPTTAMPEMPLEKGFLDLNKLLIARPAATFFMRAGESSSKHRVYKDDILVVDRALEPSRQSLVVIEQEAELGIRRLNEIQDEIIVWGTVAWVIHKPT